MRRTAALALLLAATACGGPVAPYASLPGDAVVGAGDPTRAAIFGSAYAFGAPDSLAGRPDAAARAAMDRAKTQVIVADAEQGMDERAALLHELMKC